MNNYFVSYSYTTLGINSATFADNYGYEKVQAKSSKEAVAKARKNAPKGARYFRVRAI